MLDLSTLNSEQYNSVTCTEGAVLILAGAGTGKTRVLTTRLAYILQQKLAFSYEILSVTFTNKAASEMSQKIANLVGNDMTNDIWIGTFHSIGARILRRHAELVGLSSKFSVIDSADSERVIKNIIINNLGLDIKNYTSRFVADCIQRWKDLGYLPEDVPEGILFDDRYANAKRVYIIYQEELKRLNVADFGDLLLLNIKLFTDHLDVLSNYQNRFKYIMVDEYQDTNSTQYKWLLLLAKKNGNICCVGDDDQSIYSWRGADINNILNFEKDFPKAKIIRLEKNYRSSSNILNVADSIIKNNKDRLGKNLYSHDDRTGDSVVLQGCWDATSEVRFVARQGGLLNHNGYKWCDMAILVRTSAQMLILEDELTKNGIPHKIVGGVSFYDRAEVKDIISYFKCIYQHRNDLAVERVINKPRRGIGDTSVDKLREKAQLTKTSIYDVIKDNEEILNKGAMQKIREFFELLERLYKKLGEFENLSDWAEVVIDETGYRQMLKSEGILDAQNRLENLNELCNSLYSFDSLDTFLEFVTLVNEKAESNRYDAITIMTLHRAKGLEYPVLFLLGWEDGLFPNSRSIDEGNKAIEEERRLAYVGVTRAIERLFITYATRRNIRGRWQFTKPSRFLNELSENDVEETMDNGVESIFRKKSINTEYSSFYKNEDFNSNKGWGSYQYYNNSNHYSTTDNANKKNNKGSNVEKKQEVKKIFAAKGEFKTGDKVAHDKFGEGYVIASLGEDKLVIDFGEAGIKKLMVGFVKKL